VNPALSWAQAPPPHGHVVYAAERDRFGRLFLHYHCNLCGDTSSKLCTNPSKITHWLQYYLGFHPPTAHAK